MRQVIRKLVNGALGKYGFEIRRKHEPAKFLSGIPFAFVIDGGANVGDYAVEIRKQYPQAEIHSFEPTPALFQGLQARFASDAKIKCYDKALSDTEGTAQFHVTPTLSHLPC